MAEVQIQKMSHRHDAMIDWLLANPEVKNLEALCRELNVSRSWLSVVMRSDVFQAEYRRRRIQHVGDMEESILQKQLRLHDMALERLIEFMGQDAEMVDPDAALSIAEKTAAMCGFGPSKGNAPVVGRRVVERVIEEETVNEKTMEVARKRMRERVFSESEHVPQLGSPE